MTAEPLLSVRDLSVEFRTGGRSLRAVEEVSFDLFPGEVLGLVGESGSGKSVTAMSLLRLLAEPPARITAGTAHLSGTGDLLKLSPRALRRVRGKEIAVIFQDPMTSLNPVFTVGNQIAEAIGLHRRRREGRPGYLEAEGLLELVEIPHAAVRARQYPHEYSGGMRQRAMIAMSLANDPKVIIADEPTTALDVTVQAHVLEVLRAAQERTGAGMILITHDLGVIAEMADRVAVMYAGRIVEIGSVRDIFRSPRHPYTAGLLQSLPRIDGTSDRLESIPGQLPGLADMPPGCRFHPRCALGAGRRRCQEEKPTLFPSGEAGRAVACHFQDEMPIDPAMRAAS
ncbi:MAG: ABC transporter ATP-binding protein [Bauldia sp.]|nr:ABC transporter ATP-binding protein [Bauldia sp.]